MIANCRTLLRYAPIVDMIDHKVREHGVSYGLSEAGYDIRIKQEIIFYAEQQQVQVDGLVSQGLFTIASAIEEFQIPDRLVGIVHDKSTWARQGLSVFNTVIESSWTGFLTLELVYHGKTLLRIPAGAGIAQVVFHETTDPAYYSGKYQRQPDQPVHAILE